MAVSVSYPGVYVEEFVPGAPIQGVGTATAAFLGPATMGPIQQPTRIRTFDAFKATFGAVPLKGFYLWYAVRGFFENGGQDCYVVRISSAAAAELPLLERPTGATQAALIVTAKAPGTATALPTVQVDESSAITTGKLFRAEGEIHGASGTQLTLKSPDEVARFRPGDLVIVDGHPASRAKVLSANGKILTLDKPLPNAAPTAAGYQRLRLADFEPGDTTFRLTIDDHVDNPADLTSGTVLMIHTSGSAKTAEAAVVVSVATELIGLSAPPNLTTYRVTIATALMGKYTIAAGDKDVTALSIEFDLSVTGPTPNGPKADTYAHLSMEPSSPRYWATVNTQSQFVTLSTPIPPSTTAAPDYLPGKLATTSLAGGSDEELDHLLPSDYQSGLEKLAAYRTINIVAIPDRQDPAVQRMLWDHVEGNGRPSTSFAIFDSLRGTSPTGTGSVLDQRGSLDSFGGHGALYYPWILVDPAPRAAGTPPPPAAPPPVLVPPSGHVAGVYARIDASRGVHKAPAGEEATISGALGVEFPLSDMDQGVLNVPSGVNVIRVFKPGGIPAVWGARTTASGVNSTWQYVNIRRLFHYLEDSITAGIRWAVFEPNNPELWGKLKRSITAFLTRVWHDGGLFGATAKDAFYVRIDDTLNPPDQLALGYLTIEIGVRPSYPAEFIVVRIGIREDGTQITES